MSFLLHRTSKHNSYILQSKFRGHSGGIVRLCATEDGRLLASGGTDSTKIWDLTTMRELGSPKSPETRGASTALVWIKREDDLGEALFYGTQNGQLVCWREGKQDARTIIQRGTMSLKEVFSLELQNVAPRAIVFGQMYFNDRDIMVLGLYGGNIYTFRGNDGKAVGVPWNVGALIGDIALDVRKGVLIMDEPSLGTNLYRLEDHTRVKTFPVAVTKQKRLRQVDFLEECKFIVSGSDHGIVYVFDRRSGEIVDELRVDPREWVQTIAAADCAGVSTIFAARSRDLVGSNKNFVWHKKSKKRFGVVGIACVVVAFGFQRSVKIPMYNI
ncbi:WD40-repeat-containing domain protein [Mycena olivaceomarginata]|nr:WD40-repeat-containing domain protein [Mycena olivaceomarginata]